VGRHAPRHDHHAGRLASAPRFPRTSARPGWHRRSGLLCRHRRALVLISGAGIGALAPRGSELGRLQASTRRLGDVGEVVRHRPDPVEHLIALPPHRLGVIPNLPQSRLCLLLQGSKVLSRAGGDSRPPRPANERGWPAPRPAPL